MVYEEIICESAELNQNACLINSSILSWFLLQQWLIYTVGLWLNIAFISSTDTCMTGYNAKRCKKYAYKEIFGATWAHLNIIFTFHFNSNSLNQKIVPLFFSFGPFLLILVFFAPSTLYFLTLLVYHFYFYTWFQKQ